MTDTDMTVKEPTLAPRDQLSGFRFEWHRSRYPEREACPGGLPGRPCDCGLVWANIPGVPGGRILCRQNTPHIKRSGWNALLCAPKAPDVEDRDQDLVALQHRMYATVRPFQELVSWVATELQATDRAWRARLLSATGKTKDLAGGSETGREANLLAGLSAIFKAMLRPGRIKVFEASGDLIRLWAEGFFRGRGNSETMQEAWDLALPHVVQLYKGTKIK